MAGRTDLVFPVNSHPDLVNGTASLCVSNGITQGAEVSTSPQGKGVGVFALSGENGLAMEDQMKDPKVNELFLKIFLPPSKQDLVLVIDINYLLYFLLSLLIVYFLPLCHS